MHQYQYLQATGALHAKMIHYKRVEHQILILHGIHQVQ